MDSYYALKLQYLVCGKKEQNCKITITVSTVDYE